MLGFFNIAFYQICSSLLFDYAKFPINEYFIGKEIRSQDLLVQPFFYKKGSLSMLATY